VQEPTPAAEDEADRRQYAAVNLEYPEGPAHRRVSICVSDRSEVTVDVARFREAGPSHHTTCVGVEINNGMSPERRTALLGHVGEMLTLAATQLPDEQRDFMAAECLDPTLGSFERLGSAASKQALGPILAGTQSQPNRAGAEVL
jgi:hypothetical protein